MLSGRLGNGYFFFVLIAIISILGGIHSPTIAWLFVIPLGAGLTIGPRDAAFWTFASILAIAFMYLIDSLDVYQGPGVPEHIQAVLNFILACFLILIFGVLLVTGLERHRILEVKLANSIKLQKNETETAQILADAASAANEEIEFERAAKDCLDILCKSQGWAAGRLWLVQEEQMIIATEIFHLEHPEGMCARMNEAAQESKNHTFARRVVDSGSGVLVSTTLGDEEQWQGSLGELMDMHSQFAWPVFSGGAVTAVIEFFSFHDIEFDERTKNLLNHVALQLSHVRGREEAREQIESMAYSDLVTGLPNRYAFEREMSRTLAAARRSGTQVALMFIDLDGFKRVNDTLGHLAGDQLLRIVGERLSNNIRSEDIAAKLSDVPHSLVARLGGDEFTVVLQGLNDFRGAELAAQRFLDAISAPMTIDGTELSIDASIGIAVYPDDAAAAGDLLLSADAAMYEAKKLEGSCFNFSTRALNESVRRQRWLETEISKKHLSDKLYLEYQPIVAATSHERVAFEALARWRHDGGVIQPEEFVPVAEKTGLIHSLGEEVIYQACVVAARLNTPVHGAISEHEIVVHANISPHQFRDASLAKKIASSLDRSGCKPQWISLEFTENSMIVDDQRCKTLLAELGGMGIRFVLDDFGTGYASLRYLRRFPFSNIKIDQSFVHGLLGNEEDRAIVQATISMAHALGLPVTAEGIESLDQAQALEELGCDFLQGNYFGMPEPLA